MYEIILKVRHFHIWTPPPPLIKGGEGGRTFRKLSHLEGFKSEKGVDVEMGGLPLFYYLTVQSHLHVGKVRFPLLLFESI